MQWSNKKQIAQAIYEDNLVVVGRQVPKYRRKRIVPRRHHRASLIILSLMLSVAVAYSAVSISRDKPGKQVVASTAVAAQAGINLAVVNPAQLGVAGINAVASSRNTLPGAAAVIAGPSTTTNTTDTNATGSDITASINLASTTANAKGDDAGPVYAAIGMDDSLDHFFHNAAAAPVQDELASLNLSAYKSLTHTQVPLARLFGLGVRTIVIDPGHGGKDPGAVGKRGTQEKDIALAIALRLRDRLKHWNNFKVYMTRDDDTYVPLSKRVNFANEKHADLFVSIHTNSFPSENMNFIETYYFGPNSDSTVTRLAETENKDSDFVYAQFKEMLQNISDNMKFQESKKLASAVQRTLYTNMHKMNAKAHNHGIKPAPFVVLLGLDAPSILTEVTNLSDRREEQRLNTKQYRDKIAKFLEKGIVTYLNKVTSDKDSTTVTKTGGRGNATEKEKLAQEEAH